MKSALLSLALTFAGLTCAAQTAITPTITPLASSMVEVCTEGCTITGVAGNSSPVFQFGTAATWDPTLTSPTLPLSVNCGSGVTICNTLGGDPAFGANKQIDAQQLPSTTYTVAWTDGSGAAHTTVIPAQVCSAIPTAFPTTTSNGMTFINLQNPATPMQCPPLPNTMIFPGTDGASITGWLEGAPVIFQRCVGTAPALSCSAPMILGASPLPMLIGPSVNFGGPQSASDASGQGTLYILPSVQPNTVQWLPAGAAAGTTPTSTIIAAISH